MTQEQIYESQKIARIIHNQLGGTRFDLMTGSYNFVVIDNGIEFKLRRNQSKANWMEIKLNGLDLYDIKFLKVRGGNVNKKYEYVPITTETVKEINNVYFDQLQELFTQETGLYTRL